MRRLRLILTLVLVGLIVAAPAAPVAFARGGSGSSSFHPSSPSRSSGGSSYSGGSSSSGGSHYRSYGGSSYGSGGGGLSGGVIILLIVVIGGILLVNYLVQQSKKSRQEADNAAFYQARSKRKRELIARNKANANKRDADVRAAANVAAGDDQRFAPEAVQTAAGQLFKDIQVAWDADDVAKLHTLVGPDLMVEWERRLDDFRAKGWRNEVAVLSEPIVQYVNVINRTGSEHDRVVVRLQARLRDVVRTSSGEVMNSDGNPSANISIAEYWTLAPEGDTGWKVISIEQDDEGAHNLTSEIVAAEEDDSRIHDASIVEVATADTAPAGVAVAELVSTEYENDARLAALDLSLVDGRFAPDVLEVAARRVASGWAEAVDGADDALAAVASPEALDRLLYGGDISHKRRVVVRGPVIEQLTITSLDGKATPPTMQVRANLRGRRYVEDRDTAAVLSGAKNTEQTWTEFWTLALTDAADNPWKLVHGSRE